MSVCHSIAMIMKPISKRILFFQQTERNKADALMELLRLRRALLKKLEVHKKTLDFCEPFIKALVKELDNRWFSACEQPLNVLVLGLDLRTRRMFQEMCKLPGLVFLRKVFFDAVMLYYERLFQRDIRGTTTEDHLKRNAENWLSGQYEKTIKWECADKASFSPRKWESLAMALGDGRNNEFF